MAYHVREKTLILPPHTQQMGTEIRALNINVDSNYPVYFRSKRLTAGGAFTIFV